MLFLNDWNIPLNAMLRKKYQLNFNMATYSIRTGLYENNDSKYPTFIEARKSKWKCEICSEKFQNYRMLVEHKVESHSY